MSRAHLFRPLQDAAGNLQRGATVRILRPGTTVEVSNTLYVAEDGTDAYSQPINCPQGFLSVFMDQARRVRVGVTPFGGGTEVFFDDIDVARTFQDAAEVPIDAIGGMQSLDVQAALEELQINKFGVGSDVPRQSAGETSYDATAPLTAPDVQTALDEVAVALDGLDTDLADHEADTDDAHDASAVSFTPVSPLIATDVQAALEELQAAITASSGTRKVSQSKIAFMDLTTSQSIDINPGYVSYDLTGADLQLGEDYWGVPDSALPLEATVDLLNGLMVPEDHAYAIEWSIDFTVDAADAGKPIRAQCGGDNQTVGLQFQDSIAGTNVVRGNGTDEIFLGDGSWFGYFPTLMRGDGTAWTANIVITRVWIFVRQM